MSREMGETTMGKYTYHCVSCGETLHEESVLTSLSELVFNGALEDVIGSVPPIYITKDELQRLSSRKKKCPDDDRDANYITMEELFWYVFRNRDDITSEQERKRQADGAFKRYAETYRIAKEKREQAASAATAAAATAMLRSSRSDDDDSDDGYRDNRRSRQTKAHVKSFWNDVEMPGIDARLKDQVIANFEDGTCYFDLDLMEGFAYKYQMQRAGKKAGVCEKFYCPHCKNEVADNAFKCRQVLIGLVGAQSTGKTCLITAMANDMLKSGGIVDIPNKTNKKRFGEDLARYRMGFRVAKTDAVKVATVNLNNPSVLQNEILYTFIDIPGDKILNPNTGEIDIKALVAEAKFNAILHCDAYLLCARVNDVQNDSVRGTTILALQKFVQAAGDQRSKERRKNPELGDELIEFPILLTFTQLDGERVTSAPNKEDGVPYIMQEYLPRYKKEYNIMWANGLDLIKDFSQNRFYYTPISSSAYGFDPKPAEFAYCFDECLLPSYRRPEEEIRQNYWEKRHKEAYPNKDDYLLDYAIKEYHADVEALRAYGYDISDIAAACNMDDAALRKCGLQPSDITGKQDVINTIKERIEKKIQAQFHPRNLDLLLSWVKMILGLEPNCEKQDRSRVTADWLDFDRNETHLDDNRCMAVAQLFCNPTKQDVEWYTTLKGGPWQELKRWHTRQKAKKEQHAISASMKMDEA